MTEAVEEKTGYLSRELPGLFSLFLAVALFLALVSHHTQDPSLSSYSTSGGQTEINNYIGLVGAYLSGVLVDLFGLAAFWPVLIFLAASWRLFRGKPFRHPWMTGIGTFLLLLSAAGGFSMLFPRLEYFWPKTPGGGLLGDILARNLVLALNPVGAGLLLGAAVLIALILGTGFSIIGGMGVMLGWVKTAAARAALARNKHRERAERAKRLHDVLEQRKSKPEPKVQDKGEKKKPRPRQEAFDFPAPEGEFQLPAGSLLDEPEKTKVGLDRNSLMANARMVEKKLGDFNVQGEVVEVSTGPVITMYEYKPAPGVKISKIAGLADDLAMNMRAVAIRIVAPLPGKAAIGIEIPNPKREFVYLKEVIESEDYRDSASPLTLVMGVDIMGRPVVSDLKKMPHLLIAGATGAGKSVGLNAIIMSILYKARPDEVRFLMIDPKRIELSLYKDMPHLIYPVISDPKDATQALKWAVADMEHRYQLLAEKGVRNIETYNKLIKKELAQKPAAPPPPEPKEDGEEQSEVELPPQPLPYLVIIIDELADLMMVSAKEVEASITRLAQMARAAGIHLILATQRPSVDVLTGVIKANMPTRVSFQVSSKIDSRTILDTSGAEKLLGAGDMLFLPPGTSTINRIHGAYVSEEEIKRVTEFVKAQASPDYLDDLTPPQDDSENGEGGDEDYDEKYDEAVELVTRSGKASISLVQRHLRIGYNRAARIIEVMEREGVVGPADGAKPREVLAREL